jgi:PDZ domain
MFGYMLRSKSTDSLGGLFGDSSVFAAKGYGAVLFLALVILWLLPSPLQARKKAELPFDTSSTVEFHGSVDSIPEVRFITGNAGYLLALNADLYPTPADVRAETRWIRRHSKDLKLFWAHYGDSALASMATYAGIPWSQREIRIDLVRYLSTWELSSPATIPLGGRRLAGIMVAGPSGAEQILQLLHVLAHQLINQTSRLEYPQINHALMKKTPYHLENIIELLALSVAADILSHDKLLEAINSANYARRHPGFDLFFSDLWEIWTLSADYPLIKYLAEEPFSGSVRFRADSTLAANTIRKSKKQTAHQRDIPPGGQMGIALEQTASGLKVLDADPERLAFAYGISEGDVIRTINGATAKNLREFYGELLSTYETTGAKLRVRRGSDEFTVTILVAPSGFDISTE